MKSWKNYTIIIVTIISFILGFSRYFAVKNNFVYSINSRITQYTNQYSLEKYLLEKNVIEPIYEGKEITKETFVEYLSSTYDDNENPLEAVSLYNQKHQKLYSYNENLGNVDKILNQQYENYTLDVINNKHYMIFSSHWDIGDDILYLVNAYNVEDLYEERNRQIKDFIIRDVIILIFAYIITYIFLILITKYVNKVNLQAKQREDFINGFTHELKTPMTATIGYSDMLRLRKCDEETSNKALNYIYLEAKRLENLSHKLLSLMSISGQKIEFQNIEIKSFILRLIPNILTQNKIEIKLEEDIVIADSELLEVVIRNLVQNSDKAEPKDNKILIKGEILDNKKYRISIIDKGNGIPKEHIPRVTEDFYMVDKSRSRQDGGSGIGLSLVKKILTFHNSKLFIESEEGVGTTVYFDLKEGKNEKNSK